MDIRHIRVKINTLITFITSQILSYIICLFLLGYVLGYSG